MVDLHSQIPDRKVYRGDEVRGVAAIDEPCAHVRLMELKSQSVAGHARCQVAHRRSGWRAGPWIP